MKKHLKSLLQGSFLINEDAPKHWRMILYLFFLAGLMILSAHRAESKVYEIARVNEEVQALRNTYASVRARLQQQRLESNIRKQEEGIGLMPPQSPPTKIIVQKTK